MSSAGYCEISEFYDESFPKARKQYRCIECVAPIEKGEKHLYYRGKWDGEFTADRQHMLCRELCMFIRDEIQSGECIGFGCLHEDWQEIGCASNHHSRKFDDQDRKARFLYAQIRWRERRYLTRRKRVQGLLMRRSWGRAWEVVQEVRA